MDSQIVKRVAKRVKDIKAKQVNSALDLLTDGNTIPFVARYRKEATGSLNEVQLQSISDAYDKVEALTKRQNTVIKEIDSQGKLTDSLKQRILAADDLTTVEDLYLPYKQKRRTKAQQARQAGLTPLANWLLTYPNEDLKAHAQQFVSDDVPDAESALAGAHEIIAEEVSEVSTIRQWLRSYTANHAQLVTAVRKKGKEKDEGAVYQRYYDFTAALNKLSSYQVLAINRGEKAGVLSVKLSVDETAVINYLHFRLVQGHSENDATKFVMDAAADGYRRFIAPAIERDLRKQLTEAADTEAIHVFGDNLYHLLMQSPLRGKVVLGFDPAYRTGCKLAVLDPNGKLLKVAVIYPHEPAPKAKRDAAPQQLLDLLDQFQVQVIAIGNGTASRESVQFVSDTLKKQSRDISFVIVNEAGASVYSASETAREEFPDLPVEKRSAVSIGRRLQDPLAELVKVDPQSIGVGQYQHDMPKKELGHALDGVVERAVNQVGVNVNTASPQLLNRIAGLNSTTAKNVVKFRNDHGSYTSRKQLKDVPRLGPKAYQQAIGFLRIIGGSEPLDNTDVHPESYPVARQILKTAGLDEDELGTDLAKDKLAHLKQSQFVTDHTGAETVRDIVKALQTPGRDLRDKMPGALLRHDVLTIDDLKVGMKLQGTVRNVTDFGAFVDVGVKHDGLVYISRLAKKYVKNPREVVAVGDIVDVWVVNVDINRGRIDLTMIPPKVKVAQTNA